MKQLPSARCPPAGLPSDRAPPQRREALKELFAAGARLRALPRARGHAQDGRLRRRQRGRRPDVRRRGARAPARTSRGCRSSGAAGKLLESCWGRSACALGGLHRERAQVPPARQPRPLPIEIENCQEYLLGQVELIQPRVICTLGNFSTKLLRGDPTGITRLHGQPEVLVLGAPGGAAVPDLPPRGRPVHAAHARDAARGLRAAAELLALGRPSSRRAGVRRAIPAAPPSAAPTRRRAPEPPRAVGRSARRRGPPSARISSACSRQFSTHVQWQIPCKRGISAEDVENLCRRPSSQLQGCR